MRLVLATFVVVVAAFFGGACATTDTNFISVDDLPDEQLAPVAYRIRGSDKLQVTVFKQESLSGEVLVREDGRITVPLVGDVAVLGKTPPEAAIEIAEKLSNTGFIDKPSVSVAVLETRQPSFAVVGEVKQPGSFELQPGTTVLDGIALSGGLSEFAEKDKIFVIRKNRRTTSAPTTPAPATPSATTTPAAAAGEAAPADSAAPANDLTNRIRFSWAKLSRSDGNSLRFHLEDGDVIVVE